ncbi:hypothetical protein TSOC_009273 [Tetrabaena socialis]|uniref:Uncharacterized protein n=1 Tax=Tetrabaena socialis TaxID=47790 RepID=A0A2J7ZWA9_9CHLO|nr:hypothetical protein TSOC_009273 [Tetrabaena socialis]|eukprot:PNH04535.1 hypothetical protein TSOC_009273 [Tetrabaena socialis]
MMRMRRGSLRSCAQASTCPYVAKGVGRCGRVGRRSLNVRAGPGSALAESGPALAFPGESRAGRASDAPAGGTVMQQILLAPCWIDMQRLFSAHRQELNASELAVVWVRLAKISKDPAVRLSPELQKFVDIMACASIERLETATGGNLCSIMWAASKLKKNLPKSGMFKSFLKVAPSASWLERTYLSFERQLDAASAEPLQALLHAAAALDLPPPQWSGRLMERLQDVDLRSLPDGNIVDLVMSMHTLHMHPPPQLSHQLHQECLKRLGEQRSGAGGGGGPAVQA